MMLFSLIDLFFYTTTIVVLTLLVAWTLKWATRRPVERDHLLDWAWTIIANAHGGDWSRAEPEWRKAATRWRDDYSAQLWAVPKEEEG